MTPRPPCPRAEASWFVHLQIREGVNEFLEEGNLLRVRVQWELVRQMFQATVHQYDEVVRHHNVQMRAEIAALRDQVGGQLA